MEKSTGRCPQHKHRACIWILSTHQTARHGGLVSVTPALGRGGEPGRGLKLTAARQPIGEPLYLKNLKMKSNRERQWTPTSGHHRSAHMGTCTHMDMSTHTLTHNLHTRRISIKRFKHKRVGTLYEQTAVVYPVSFCSSSFVSSSSLSSSPLPLRPVFSASSPLLPSPPFPLFSTPNSIYIPLFLPHWLIFLSDVRTGQWPLIPKEVSHIAPELRVWREVGQVNSRSQRTARDQ